MNINISLRNRQVPRILVNPDASETVMPCEHSPKAVNPKGEFQINIENPTQPEKELLPYQTHTGNQDNTKANSGGETSGGSNKANSGGDTSGGSNITTKVAQIQAPPQPPPRCQTTGDRGLIPPTPPNNTQLGSSPLKRESATMSNFDMNQAIKMIPEFDGNSMELHRFLQIANIHYKRVKEETLPDFLDVITSKLRGRAYNIISRYNSYDTWEELTAALEMHFSKLRSLQLVQTDIFPLSQGYKEPICNYAERAEKLLDELNIVSTAKIASNVSDEIRKLNEATVLNSFTNGLKDPLRPIIRTARTDSLRKAVEMALEEDKLIRIHSEPTISKYCKHCRTSTHNTRDCRVRNQSSSSFPRQNNQQHQNLSNYHPRYSQPPNSPYNVVRTIDKSCNYCKNSGHLISECRKKKYNDERNNNSRLNYLDPNSNSFIPTSARTSENFTVPGPTGIQGPARQIR